MPKPKRNRNSSYQQGYDAGKQAAKEFIHAFLNERMESLTDIPGIGEKTALKIYEHFNRRMDV